MLAAVLQLIARGSLLRAPNVLGPDFHPYSPSTSIAKKFNKLSKDGICIPWKYCFMPFLILTFLVLLLDFLFGCPVPLSTKASDVGSVLMSL